MTIKSTTATSVSLAWASSWDNVAITGYAVFENGVRIGSTSSTGFAVYGLACATTYTFAVAAFDAAGNESVPFRVSASTAACGSPAPSGDVFVAPGGSDANPCTAAAPCLTLGRAYRAALPGQTVQIASGSYPPQIIAFDASKLTDAAITFRPAPGATVSISTLDFGQAQERILGPAHVAVVGLRVGLLRAWAGADDVLWENIDGGTFGIFDATNVTVRGGDFGPCEAPRQGACKNFIAGTAANILVDGAYIHDITSSDPVNNHPDGIFLRGSRNVVIRKSRFRGNDVDNIRLQDQACCLNQNITIENNWFAPSLQGNGATRADSIDVDTPTPGLLIRNNSFAEGTGVQIRGSQTSVRLVGNLLTNIGCVSGVAYAYNVFLPFSSGIGQTPCGATDKKVAGFGYVSGPGFDYHITAGSPALGAGDAGNCPGDDIDNQARAGRCDAGSDQR